jgi:hypothetical protein
MHSEVSPPSRVGEPFMASQFFEACVDVRREHLGLHSQMPMYREPIAQSRLGENRRREAASRDPSDGVLTCRISLQRRTREFRTEELELARSTCRNEVLVYESLSEIARSWEVTNPHSRQSALIEAIASRYTERYMGGSITGETFIPPKEPQDVHTEGCSRGLVEGLRESRRRS